MAKNHLIGGMAEGTKAGSIEDFRWHNLSIYGQVGSHKRGPLSDIREMVRRGKLSHDSEAIYTLAASAFGPLDQCD